MSSVLVLAQDGWTALLRTLVSSIGMIPGSDDRDLFSKAAPGEQNIICYYDNIMIHALNKLS